MGKFENFLINEDNRYLGQKVNDLLTGMQDIQQDMPNLGTRHLNKLADQVVNQIRKILHSQWPISNQKHLKDLQKAAVAIKKTIDEKGDLKEVLPAAVQLVQQLAAQLGVKVNTLKAPELPGMEVSPEDFELTGTGPNPKPNKPAANFQMPNANAEMPQPV